MLIFLQPFSEIRNAFFFRNSHFEIRNVLPQSEIRNALRNVFIFCKSFLYFNTGIEENVA